MWAAPQGRRSASGDASGDVFHDLPLLARLGLDRGRRLAGATAAVVGAAAFAGGWLAEGDPGSGLVRGAFEAAALLLCYSVLAGPLALRRASDA